MTVPFTIFTPLQRPTLEDFMGLGLVEGGVDGVQKRVGGEIHQS